MNYSAKTHRRYPPRLLTALLLLAALPVASPRAGDRNDRPQTDPFSCSAEGTGGDPLLNQQKNRTTEPSSYRAIAFADLEAMPTAALAAKLPRRRWPAWWAEKVSALEGQAVSVEGRLMSVQQMGVESCNCKDVTLRDLHFMLAETADAPRGRWLVTELTPRVRTGRPSWHLKRLRALVKRHARIRVSGWLLYDQEHLDLVGRTRLTPWELHPVMKIEVWNGDRWAEF